MRCGLKGEPIAWRLAGIGLLFVGWVVLGLWLISK